MNNLNQVIARLEAQKGNWVAIAKEAEVSYSWITKLAANKIPNPGIHTIEKLDFILRKAA